MSDAVYLSLEQLRVGLYIHLDMKWMDHSFAFSDFKIKSEDQLQEIRRLPQSLAGQRIQNLVTKLT